MGTGRWDGMVMLRLDGDGADEVRVHDGRWKSQG